MHTETHTHTHTYIYTHGHAFSSSSLLSSSLLSPQQMAIKHVIGSPIGADRKSARHASPLQEMAGLADTADAGDEAKAPFPQLKPLPGMPGGSTGAPPGVGGVDAGTPNANSGSQVTMEALENLFDRKLGAVLKKSSN